MSEELGEGIEISCQDIICSCCNDASSDILKIYDFIEVPISAIIGFVIAWFFNQRRQNEKKMKKKEVMDVILDTLDFLYIGVENMSKEKEIPESIFDSVKSTQNLLLSTLRNSSTILEQQEIHNMIWIVEGQDVKMMLRYNPKFRRIGRIYIIWVAQIEQLLRKYKGNTWNEGIIKKKDIIKKLENEVKKLDDAKYTRT